MSKLKILVAGDPVLRQKAQEDERMDKKTLRLLDDMAETMYAANGVGLAAPQIGVLKRIVVIDVGEGLIELINPVITYREGSAVGPKVKWNARKLCIANIMTVKGAKCLLRQTGFWQFAFSTNLTIWTEFCL